MAVPAPDPVRDDPPSLGDDGPAAVAGVQVAPLDVPLAPAPDRAAPEPRPSATTAIASWFGPGLYGNRTACGLTLTTELLGLAHRTLPCGSPVTLRYGWVTLTVPVVDRGPYIYAREFDLTNATKARLGCPDICSLEWLR